MSKFGNPETFRLLEIPTTRNKAEQVKAFR
jgi:hypothetical protein